MYNIFKTLLSAAETIGTVETAELSDYESGWVAIEGKTLTGDEFTMRLIIKETEDGNK